MTHFFSTPKNSGLAQWFYTMMMIHQDGLPAHWAERAQVYDEQSLYDKGDRQQQFRILVDFLSFVAKPELEFCDLGCGTGFFTRAFLESGNNTRGLAIDASPEMLAISRARLTTYGDRIAFYCKKLEDIWWRQQPHKFDVVFSSLAIHHLEDPQKWRMFQEIYAAVRPGGHFILFDLIRFVDDRDNKLLEYLACRDIQRRLMSHLQASRVPAELAIERLIDNDRRMRSLEGDKEAVLTDIVGALRNAGFDSIIQIFQDTRIMGLCCLKV